MFVLLYVSVLIWFGGVWGSFVGGSVVCVGRVFGVGED